MCVCPRAGKNMRIFRVHARTIARARARVLMPFPCASTAAHGLQMRLPVHFSLSISLAFSVCVVGKFFFCCLYYGLVFAGPGRGRLRVIRRNFCGHPCARSSTQAGICANGNRLVQPFAKCVIHRRSDTRSRSVAL